MIPVWIGQLFSGPSAGQLLGSLVWLALMLAATPLADRVATVWVAQPPNLAAFRGLQQSRAKLLLGILVAWLLGAFLEELFLRGIVLWGIETRLQAALPTGLAAPLAILSAAGLGGLLHLYQGARAALIVGQLSALFGLLFVWSGHNLWPVILCHGAYDTLAFVRFARKQSRYSRLPAES